MDQPDTIREALSSGQLCKVIRIDTTTGVLACPKLLYPSDNEEEDNLPNAQDDNLHGLAGGPGSVEPFQAPEPMDPHFEQSPDEVRRIMALSDQENPLLKDEDVDLPENLSNVEWIEFLVKKGPTITAPKNRGQTIRILRKLAREIKVLPPGNDVDVGDWPLRYRPGWGTYLDALVAEMMTVEDGCSSEVRDAGVFVLSTFPYPDLLEWMALEILSAGLHS